MNKTKKQSSEYPIDPQIFEGFQNIKNKHKEFFQSLQQKLIIKSSKFSNFMGMVHTPNLMRTQSQNLDHDEDHFSESDHRKFAQSSSVSPVKKRIQLTKNYTLQNSQIFQPSKQPSFNETMAKLMKLREEILDRKNMSRSSNSSLQNQRKLAYDLDYTIAEIDAEESNGINGKHNAKEIYEITYEQKKKLTQTISTSSSLKHHKVDYLQVRQKFLNKVALKDFEIIRPLGEGKFGTVYLSRHIKTNFICAIKKMPKFFEDQTIVQQLIREIKIQSFLNHPNICQLYTYFLESDFIYLVIELCNSGNIYTILRKHGRFEEQKVRNIIKQVCHAVQYLHEHDIIHRDIKPENIIFHQNVAKLCDFGWSVYAPLSRGTLCGTPIYASPQLVKKMRYDSKIDIWNIGILTYELLFGRVPFEIRCQDDLQKVVEQQIYFPKSVQISSEAIDFICQCLNKNPKNRISIVKMLDHSFVYQKETSKNSQ